MKKYVLICALGLGFLGCSSASKEASEVTESSAIREVPTDKSATPTAVAVVEDIPKRQDKPTTKQQTSKLDEAIRAQSDERVYTAATEILAQNSKDVRALNALGIYHYKRKRYDLAQYLFNQALAVSKDSAVYSNLGLVQLAQGENRLAVNSFRNALKLNSRDGVAASNLGAIYVKERDFTKAFVVLETAYKYGPKDIRTANNYAVTLTAKKKYSDANGIYKSILKQDNNNPEVLYNYATLLVEHMKQYNEGLEIINRLKFVGGPEDTRNRIIALENKAKAGLK